MKTVLIIDDCDDFRSTASDVLLDNDYYVIEARCPDEAYSQLKGEQVDMIICDLTMPFTYGKEFFNYPYSSKVGVQTIKELVWTFPYKPILAVTGMTDSEIDKVAPEIGTVPILQKPCSPSLLLASVNVLIAEQMVEAVQ